jgi:hypothetical protein
VYAHDDGGVTEAVREWCLTAGSNSKNRIVLAGFDTEHVELEKHGWRVYEWFKKDGLLVGGMGSQQHRERLRASPIACIPSATRRSRISCLLKQKEAPASRVRNAGASERRSIKARAF